MHIVAAVVLFSCVLSVQAGSRADVESWAATLAHAVGVLEDGLGVQTLQSRYDDYSYTRTTRDGATLFAEIHEAINQTVTERLAALVAVRDATKAAYESPPAMPAPTPDECCHTALPLSYSNLYLTDVNFDQQCMRYAQGLSETNATLVEADVAAFAEVTPTFVANQEAVTTLKWQYVGAQTGAYGIYPGVGRSVCNDYDPRFRPWYVLGATPVPKDVVVVLDTSGSMSNAQRLERAQEAAAVVLQTLSPNAVSELVSWVNSRSAGGGTQYVLGLSKAFDLFYDSPDLGNDRVLLFLSDGDPTEIDDRADGEAYILNSLATLQAALGAKSATVMTYTLGTDLESTVIETMAAQHGGRNEVIPDDRSEDLGTIMGSYYGVLTTSGLGTAPAVWTTPYFDASGLGVVITAALPVLANDELLGVAGVDLTLDDLLGGATYFRSGSLSYAFVIDDHGRAITHPSLVLPTNVAEPPVFVDINNLETDEEFAAIRTAMLNGEQGSMSFTKTVSLPRGDSQLEGIRVLADVEVTYVYGPIPGTPLSLCLALAAEDAALSQLSQAPEPTSGQRFHRVDLTAEPECMHFDQQAIISRSTYKFAPSAYRNPALHVEANLTLSATRDLQRRMNDADDMTELVPELDLVDVDASRLDVWATAPLDAVWVSADSVREYAAWRYVGTSSGTFRTFPGHASAAAYDPTLRPWYHRAETNVGRASFSTPYLDAAGAGDVITMSHTVVDRDNKVAAVLGMDFSLFQFEQLLVDSGCENKGDQHQCWVIDESGYVVWHPSLLSAADLSATWMSTYAAQLPDAMASVELIRTERCISFPESLVYTFTLMTREAYTWSLGENRAEIVPVDGTNIAIVHIIGSAHTSTTPTLRPSTADLAFDPCDNSFDLTGLAGEPVCVPPPPVGSLAFAPQPAVLPPACYGDTCSTHTTVEACEADISCRSQCPGADGFCLSKQAPDSVVVCPSPSPEPLPYRTVSKRIVVHGVSLAALQASGGYDTFLDDLKAAIAGASASLSPDDIEIVSVRAGSIIVDYRVFTQSTTADSEIDSAVSNDLLNLGPLTSNLPSSACDDSPCSVTASTSTGGGGDGGGGGGGGGTVVIAVAVVAAVLVVAIVVVVVVMRSRRRRRNTSAAHTAQPAVASAPAPAPAPAAVPAAVPASAPTAHAVAPPYGGNSGPDLSMYNSRSQYNNAAAAAAGGGGGGAHGHQPALYPPYGGQPAPPPAAATGLYGAYPTAPPPPTAPDGGQDPSYHV